MIRNFNAAVHTRTIIVAKGQATRKRAWDALPDEEHLLRYIIRGTYLIRTDYRVLRCYVLYLLSALPHFIELKTQVHHDIVHLSSLICPGNFGC